MAKDRAQSNRDVLLDSQTREAMDTITKLSHQKATIDLDTFVRVYLPALGQSHEDPLSLVPWVKLAGGPFMPVDVVSNGRVVHTVPPLLNRTQTVLNSTNGQSLSNLVEIANKKRDVSPNLGINHLRQGLEGRVQDRRVVVSELLEWNSILTKYGYSPIEIPDAVKNADPSEPASDGNDNIFTEYEDL